MMMVMMMMKLLVVVEGIANPTEVNEEYFIKEAHPNKKCTIIYDRIVLSHINHLTLNTFYFL